jgi:cytochrome c biogenesis protein CcdA
MIRWLIVIAMLMHGVGHIMFFLESFTDQAMGFSAEPWLLPGGFTAASPVGKAFALLWLLAMLGFLAAAIGLLLRQEWWPALAVAAAVISLVVLLPWWNVIAPSSRVWVLLADVVIIVAFGLPWKTQVIEALG